jgi:hypothetical protein
MEDSKMKNLKLGIIGMSPGNGHPYSWSAIFNGYDTEYMQNCPFPVIPEYLSKQKFPQDTIKNASVTHIWTQDIKISQHIAKASKIENIVKNYKDLIGAVDAILLARDDYQTHYKFSKPFIEAGLPIYIDKPIAITKADAEKIFSLEKHKNQIFTCSALSYAKEFELSATELADLGTIKYVDACIAKDWEKYGIHIIEPTLTILNKYKILTLKDKIKHSKISSNKNQKIVTFTWGSGLITTFKTLGQLKSPIKIYLYGDKGCKELEFKDSFYAFKKALQTFVNIIHGKEDAPDKKFILKIIDVIEKGLDNE